MKENSPLKYQISFTEHGGLVSAHITGNGFYRQALGTTECQALGLLFTQIASSMENTKITNFELVCNKKQKSEKGR